MEFAGGNHRLVAVVVDGEAFRIQFQGGGEVNLVHTDAALQFVRQFFRHDIDDFLLDGRYKDESHDQEVKGDKGTDDDQGDSYYFFRNFAAQNSSIMSVYILGVESSCDDTSASVIEDTTILSNVIASQKVHAEYGGVVPELASRAHQQNIIPVIDTALKRAKIHKNQLSAIAYTNGPGLLGSLLVGSSFAKAMAFSLNLPLIEVDHLQAHVLANFLQKMGENKEVPSFPFLCLTVSGGHTLLLKVNDYFDMQILGRTIDDAAGEAFDKAAKILGLPYPGGPVIDKLAQEGDPKRFSFSIAHLPNLDYSFSGLKTSFLYFVRDQLKVNENFIEENKADLAASLQKTIIDILMDKFGKAIKDTGIKTVAIGGGVSANSGVRAAVQQYCDRRGIKAFIPKRTFTTDNAAMIAVAGHYKFLRGETCPITAPPFARVVI